MQRSSFLLCERDFFEPWSTRRTRRAADYAEATSAREDGRGRSEDGVVGLLSW